MTVIGMSLGTFIPVALFIGAVLGACPSALGQEAVEDSLPVITMYDQAEEGPPSMLIMPVVNYSEKGEAHEILLPRLLKNRN